MAGTGPARGRRWWSASAATATTTNTTNTSTATNSGENSENSDPGGGGADDVALALLDLLRFLAAEGHIAPETPVIVAAFGTACPGTVHAIATARSLARSLGVCGLIAFNGFVESDVPRETAEQLVQIAAACAEAQARVPRPRGSGASDGPPQRAAPLFPLLTRMFGASISAGPGDAVSRLAGTCAGGTAMGAAALLRAPLSPSPVTWCDPAAIDCVVALVRSERDALVPAQGTAGIVRALGNADGCVATIFFFFFFFPYIFSNFFFEFVFSSPPPQFSFLYLHFAIFNIHHLWEQPCDFLLSSSNTMPPLFDTPLTASGGGCDRSKPHGGARTVRPWSPSPARGTTSLATRPMR
jgi:hypothetical protein